MMVRWMCGVHLKSRKASAALKDSDWVLAYRSFEVKGA